MKSRDWADKATTILGIPLALMLLLWGFFVTWTAFFGGTAPLSPFEFTNVNIIRGLFWLLIVDPIIAVVSYWVLILILIPAVGLVAGVGAAADKLSQHPQE